MKKIIHTVRIHAAPKKVYHALTTHEGVTGWWSTGAKLEPGVGGIIESRFVAGFNPRLEQTTLKEGTFVGWRCIEGHSNWHDSTFMFRLLLVDGETQLRFIQEYEEDPGDDAYGTYNFNWGYYLNSLKRYCERGAGTPFDPGAGP